MSELRNGAETVEEDAWGGTPLVLGAALDIEAVDGGVRVTVTIAPQDDVEMAREGDWGEMDLIGHSHPSTWEPIHQKIVKRDFYTTQKYKEIANTIEDRAPDYLDGAHLAGAFRSRCEALEANEDAVKEQLQSPTVARIIAETGNVEYRQVGDEVVVSIHLTHGDEEATIEFASRDWVNAGANDFIIRYINAFRDEPDISDDDWDRLKEAWKDRAIDAGGDDYSAIDAVGEEVIDNLQRRLDVYESREALQNGAYCGWYEEHPGDRLYSLPDETGPLVWVRSLALVKELKSAGRNQDDVSELINHLTEEGVIQTGRKNIDGKRAYGFSTGADGLDISPAMVMSADDGDGTDNGHGVEL